MKKVYVVTTLSKYDYDFSVITLKHGAFLNHSNALKKLLEVVEEFKKVNAGKLNTYSDNFEHPDEKSGVLVITEDFENGYWCCTYGTGDDYECHQICISEFDIEDTEV